MDATRKYDDYLVARVIAAYLVDGASHRRIQREILGLPAPTHGGGFVTMSILHEYGIKGKHKAIFKDGVISKESDLSPYPLQILKELIGAENESENYFRDRNKVNPNENPTERMSLVRTRVYQKQLREQVLKNYGGRCALCDIDRPDLLVCSHIKPWAVSLESRLDLSNAICFCVLHDRLFDRGYFGLDSEFSIVINEKKASIKIAEELTSVKFRRPIRDCPNSDYLKFHFSEIVNVSF